MAKATFTNGELVKAYRTAATSNPKGTRGDVVRTLMVGMDLATTNADEYRKVYNNVTQRVKQLGKHPETPVTFPALEPGKKGARRSSADMTALQAILDGPAPADEEGGEE